MSPTRNAPRDFDPSLIETSINAASIHFCAKRLATRHVPQGSVPEEGRMKWLLGAIRMVDLTTLAGDDTRTNVERLCTKAKYPLSEEVIAGLAKRGHLDASNITTGAVCVYPAQVQTVVKALTRLGVCGKVHVAAVATGFPSGQYCRQTRLEEVKLAVADGADEIDMVIQRASALAGDFQAVYDDVRAMREACGDAAHLKVILAVGELGSYLNVYRASMASMLAGADFIKTSTGKETVNATLPAALVMMRAIRDFYALTGIRVGFKPAGGLRTCDDAINFMALAFEVLGEQWLTPSLFRIGASSLLGELERELTAFALRRQPHPTELSLA